MNYLRSPLALVAVIFILLFIAVVIVVVRPFGDSASNASTNIGDGAYTRHVDWVSINPPEGVEGPCWAYFIVEGYGGYSGVYCE